MTMKRANIAIYIIYIICASIFSGCMRWDYGDSEDFDQRSRGLFIINEGNFQYSNATLSFYNPATSEVDNELFFRANGMKLGDVAQSMTVYGGKGWIVINNSHVVFAIDLDSYKEVGRIENLPGPRYIHFVNDHKAYVSQLWDNRIIIVDPQTYSITGAITIDGMDVATGSTEQMVQIGTSVFCSCWSYQTDILKIDSTTDCITGRLTLGIQPKSLAVDRYGRLWAFTDGGYNDNPIGHEAPALYCIDPERFEVIKRFRFRLGDNIVAMCANSTRDKLYWINGGIWVMDVNSERLPVKPLIKSKDTIFYQITTDPITDEIYVADAIDYQQQGSILRFSATGLFIDEFYVGITPGAFCWKP